MEHFTKWEPLVGVVSECMGVDLRMVDADYEIVLHFASTRQPDSPAIRITFDGMVLAVTSYEEFVHPWNFCESGPIPKLPAPWEQSAFPLLVVHDSPWFEAVVDDEIYSRSLYAHYRFVSIGHTVDIVAAEPIHARWVPSDVAV